MQDMVSGDLVLLVEWRPGERGPAVIIVQTPDRDCRASADARTAHLVTIRADVAPGWLKSMPLASRIKPSNSLGVLIDNHLEMLARVVGGLTEAEGSSAIQALLLLVEGSRDLPGKGSPRGRSREAPFDAAARLIRRELFNPELGVDFLTREVGVSRASLFRAFRDQGGVSAYIRRLRLERAKSALSRRSPSGPSVAEVAHAHGFSSESHFSRAFRKTFGHPPGRKAASADARIRPGEASVRPPTPRIAPHSQRAILDGDEP